MSEINVLTGIVPSMDPTLKPCRVKINFFGPQGFVAGRWNNVPINLVYGALKTGDPNNYIADPAHRSRGVFL